MMKFDWIAIERIARLTVLVSRERFHWIATRMCVAVWSVVLLSTASTQSFAQKPAQPANNPQAGTQPAAPAAPLVTVTTIEDKQYQAKEAEFTEGKITVKSDPPQSVAMDELQRIAFLHESKMELEWIGQKDRDMVGIGAVDTGNGIRDVQIKATGLAAKAIKQVAIVSKKQFRVWRSDVKQSPFWKIAVDRVGQASVAEFHFEPPTTDLFETELEVTVTYNDNTNNKATLKATTHTNDKKDPEYPAEKLAASGVRIATIYGRGGDLFNGRVLSSEPDKYLIETSWLPQFELPATQIRGVFFDGSKSEVKTKFDASLAKPGTDDLILVLSRDGGVAEVTGQIQGISDGMLKVQHEGQLRKIKLDRVQAMVMADRTGAGNWKAPFQTFRMASGDLFSAALITLEPKTIKMRSAWGSEVTAPRDTIVEITGRNTRMVNLSELTPTTAEQVPYFDRKMVYVKDKSWNDRPLKLDGKTYARGLAVHSKCFLTFDLGGEYATFRSIVGFEEEAGSRGRVVCRVFADDKELFAKPDFRAVEKPVIVNVSVKGAKQLRLEVDFGEDEDIGDRVIWANARLFRE